jgi:hypothetical protein
VRCDVDGMFELEYIILIIEIKLLADEWRISKK